MTKLLTLGCFLVLILSSYAQSWKSRCDFSYTNDRLYICQLSNVNISEKGARFGVLGIHSQQHKDSDVKGMFLAAGQLMNFIPQEIFSMYENLEVFVANRVFVMEIESQTFQNCMRLTELDLAHNIIELIPNGAFSKCSQLRIINLKDNNLDQIQPDIFRNLLFLEKLNLDENYLGSEHPMVIDIKSASMQNLDLSNNGIVELPENLIYQTSNLKDLKLSSNYISLIPKEFFINSENLQELSLDRNRLSLMFSNAFKYLHKLEILDLDYNIIAYVDCDLFFNMTNLKVLKLNGNLLYAMCPTSFLTTSEIFGLEISQNAIGNLGYNPLVPLRSLKQLKKLDLSHNNVEFLDESFGLRDNVQLVVLLLNNNKIYNIHPKLFENMLALVVLDLSYNCLITLADETFWMNLNLQTLNLAHNQFIRLEYELLSHNQQLLVLNFSMNSINEINPLLSTFFVNRDLILNGNVCFDGSILRPSSSSSLFLSYLEECMQNYANSNTSVIDMPTMPPKHEWPVSSGNGKAYGLYLLMILCIFCFW